MKKGIAGITVVMLFVMLIPSWVFAGYEITQSSSSMHGSTQSKTFLSKNKYKTENGSEQMIINFATNRVIVANEKEKTYWEGTPEEYIKAMQDLQASSMKRMNDVLKKMPEAERKQIMEMHGLGATQGPVKVSVQKTGQTQEIAGYKAEKFIVNANGKPFEELWLAKGFKISSEINSEKLLAFNAKLRKTKMGGATEGEVGISKAYIDLFKSGYPVKQVFQNNVTATVDSIKKTAIPDSLFAVPPGYKKVDSIQQFFMGEHSMMMH